MNLERLFDKLRVSHLIIPLWIKLLENGCTIGWRIRRRHQEHAGSDEAMRGDLVISADRRVAEDRRGVE